MPAASSGSGKKSKKLKTAHSQLVFNPVSGALMNGGDDSELILNYEKRIQDMMMTLNQ